MGHGFVHGPRRENGEICKPTGPFAGCVAALYFPRLFRRGSRFSVSVSVDFVSSWDSADRHVTAVGSQRSVEHAGPHPVRHNHHGRRLGKGAHDSRSRLSRRAEIERRVITVVP